MTTPPSPSSASRPLPAALSEITALLDEYQDWCISFGRACGANTPISKPINDAHVDAARASLVAALRGMLDDAERLDWLDRWAVSVRFDDEGVDELNSVDEHGNAFEIAEHHPNIRAAIDTARAAQGGKPTAAAACGCASGVTGNHASWCPITRAERGEWPPRAARPEHGGEG